MTVFSIPMRTRFRGISVREGLLIRGEAGWGEWSPFLEYDADVAEPWLRCADEAAAGDWPPPLRDRIPVNVTIPAVGPARAHEIARAGGCRTAKIKVAEPGQSLADDEARVEAVRAALGPDAHLRVDANGGWQQDEAIRAIGLLAQIDLVLFDCGFNFQACETINFLVISCHLSMSVSLPQQIIPLQHLRG